jgi:hypothetical protein
VLYSSAGYWKTMGSRVCVWSHRESSAFWGAGAWNDQLYKTSREKSKKHDDPEKKNKMTSAVHSRGNISTSASQISSSSPSAFCFSDIFCSYLIFSFFLVAV